VFNCCCVEFKLVCIQVSWYIDVRFGAFLSFVYGVHYVGHALFTSEEHARAFFDLVVYVLFNSSKVTAGRKD